MSQKLRKGKRSKTPVRRDSNGEKTDDQNWNLQDLRNQLLGGDKGSAECLALWVNRMPISSR